MIADSNETIVAIATPSGNGGVGIVRISGPKALQILTAISQKEANNFTARRLVVTSVYDVDGQIIDTGLAVFMPGPASFTGQDVVEFHAHGGVVNMRALLQRVCLGGARIAERGEFSRRALQNGKLRLDQAEATLDLIHCPSDRARKNAARQMAGETFSAVESLRTMVEVELARLEVMLDFPEDTTDDEVDNAAGIAAMQSSLSEIMAICLRLENSYKAATLAKNGVQVVLHGPVNVGKSSLFNALLGFDRAIVSDTPGTTRDYVDGRVEWDGVLITLIDTAGVRQTSDSLEKEGMQRGREKAERADVVLSLHTKTEDLVAKESNEKNTIYILTKSDKTNFAKKGPLGEVSAGVPVIVTSAKNGQGIDKVKTAVLKKVFGTANNMQEGGVLTTERQVKTIRGARENLQRAHNLLVESMPFELISLELREAQKSIAEFCGTDVTDEVLDSLFAQFCIGK